MKTIVLTGGGTAGHVMPNLALVSALRQNSFDVKYIGSKSIEQELVTKAGVDFYLIQSGKLRRYFSIENAIDVFKVVIGVFQAFVLMLRLRPAVVFSKGGFVAVPVAVAARFLGIPVVSHESDLTPGLANRIIAKFARLILYSFPETGRHLGDVPKKQVPAPIREELFTGDRLEGLRLCGFTDEFPVLLVMGGSQGAQRINEGLQQILPQLVERFQIIHLTGKGKSIDFKHQNYKSFEFLGTELKHVFAATNYVVCRAGANSIFEMLALRIPMLLIPLELGSRGDQVVNAASFKDLGWALVLRETEISPIKLSDCISELALRSSAIAAAQASFDGRGGVRSIVEILQSMTSATGKQD